MYARIRHLLAGLLLIAPLFAAPVLLGGCEDEREIETHRDVTYRDGEVVEEHRTTRVEIDEK
jgi:hypothetical protein